MTIRGQRPSRNPLHCFGVVILITLMLTADCNLSEATSQQVDDANEASIMSLVPSWAMRPVARFGASHVSTLPLDLSNVTFYAQDKEDRFLFMHYFHQVHNGFYLEMGALDGISFSNSKFFHDNLGWRGLLIEPSPASYAKLVINRPNDLCLRAAICAQRHTVQYIVGKTAVDGILEFMSPKFRENFWRDINGQPQGHLIPMPCVPLQTILDSYHITKIDFWSLDVEGAELEVLQTVDFTAVYISVILTEADGTNLEKEAAIRRLLIGAGFESQGIRMRSEWFVNKSFRAQVSERVQSGLDEAEGPNDALHSTKHRATVSKRRRQVDRRAALFKGHVPGAKWFPIK